MGRTPRSLSKRIFASVDLIFVEGGDIGCVGRSKVVQKRRKRWMIKDTTIAAQRVDNQVAKLESSRPGRPIIGQTSTAPSTSDAKKSSVPSLAVATHCSGRRHFSYRCQKRWLFACYEKRTICRRWRKSRENGDQAYPNFQKASIYLRSTSGVRGLISNCLDGNSDPTASVCPSKNCIDLRELRNGTHSR